MALLRRQIELSMRPPDKELEWLEPYDDVFDKFIDYNDFQANDIIFEASGDHLEPFFVVSGSSRGTQSGELSPVVGLPSQTCRLEQGDNSALMKRYCQSESASLSMQGVVSSSTNLPGKAVLASKGSLIPFTALQIQPDATHSPVTISPSPSNSIRSKKSAGTGHSRSKSRNRNDSGICKSSGKRTPRMTSPQHRYGYQDTQLRRSETEARLNFQKSKYQFPLSPPLSGGPVQDEYPNNIGFQYRGREDSVHSQGILYDRLTLPEVYTQHQDASTAELRYQSDETGIFSQAYSLEHAYQFPESSQPCKTQGHRSANTAPAAWSQASLNGHRSPSLHSPSLPASFSPRSYDKAQDWWAPQNVPVASQPCLSIQNKSPASTPASLDRPTTTNFSGGGLKINYRADNFSGFPNTSVNPEGPIVYPGQDDFCGPLQKRFRNHSPSRSPSPHPPLNHRLNHSRSRSLTHHRRNKSSGGGGHSRATSAGFVNFTPDDSMKILTGVAPSGSSKTKARREKEAAEKRRKLSEAAVRAVLLAGGDVQRLKEAGFDAGYD